MGQYRANTKIWLSHENRMVHEGDVFETTFPDGMQLGENLTQLDAKKTRTRNKPESVTEPVTDDAVESVDSGAENPENDEEAA